MKSRLIPALLAGALMVSGGVVAAAGAGASESETLPKRIERQLAKVKRATERFKTVEAAEAAGYVATEECVVSRSGAMGVHYVNGALMGDPELDLRQPEILLYAPGRNGRLRLAGVEWFVLDGGQPAPRILGQRFQGPMTHRGTAPSHYDLHAWIYEPNPRGTFAQYNPRLRCSS